ncbi:MAG: cell division protein ZapB [Myxococcota bacterium]
MQRGVRPGVSLLILGFGWWLALPALAAQDLEEAVQAQGALIEELRRELQQVRDEQRQSGDRVQALEAELSAAQQTGAVGGVTPEYVDRRIEAFEASPLSKLTMSGYAGVTYRDAQDDGDGLGGASTFDLRFNPIFHFAMTERLHFNAELQLTINKATRLENVEFHDEDGDGQFDEADLEFETETETEVDLEYATIDYLLNDWLTVSAGKFLLPFNIFGNRLHPDWINKMVSAPPIYGGHGAAPAIQPVLSDVGLMLSGGTELWNEESKLNYALYAGNGPTTEMGGGHGAGGGGEAEQLALQFPNVPDDNNNKAVGGRVGFLPIRNLELGVSYLTGRTRGSPGRFNMLGTDVSYWWRGLDVRGEFVRKSRNASGSNPDVWGYWLQTAYRLRHEFPQTSGFLGQLGKLEPVIRWGQIRGLTALNRNQFSLGLNYWIFESVPVKFTYEFNSKAVRDDRFLVQWAYGF